MVIDVIDIMQSANGEIAREFEYNPSNDLIVSLPDGKFSAPVRVSAVLWLEGKNVLADIQLSYNITSSCSRCLESATCEVTHNYFAKYSLHPEEGEYLYKSGKVDLTASVNEEIVISQPTVVYCKSDCKGLCPVCGANLNNVDCGHTNND